MRASSVGVITPDSPATRESDDPTSEAIESPPIHIFKGFAAVGVRSGATAAGAAAVVGALVAVSVAAALADVGAPPALVGGATDDAVGSVDDVSASNESAEPEL